MDMADSSKQSMKGLTFRMAGDSRKLEAAFDPPEEKHQLGLLQVKQFIVESGFGELLIFEHALIELLKKCNAATEPLSFIIGEQRDGTFAIRYSPDLLEAYMSTTPPYGGKAITSEQVFQAIEEKGITTGVLRDDILSALASGTAQDILIARGRPPEPGTDGELVSLVPDMKERLPHCSENDVVDFRDLGEIVSVFPGDPLMRRIPPVPGCPGENIMGREIPPNPVKDVQFTPNLSGTLIDPDDENFLVAAIAGQPVIVPGGVIVEPVIKLKNIDLSTGNITFKGAIQIDGDIKAGMTVKATGDIKIGGIVEAAIVEAEGDIEVIGGIVGQGEDRNTHSETNKESARLNAKGSISALFIENAYIKAGKNINVLTFSVQSELIAGNTIIVGQEGSGKGGIIGGTSQAVTLIRAVNLGSHAGVHTQICVGLDPQVREKISSVKLKLHEKERELEENGKKLEYYLANPSKAPQEKIDETRKISEKLTAAIMELTGEKKRLQKRLESVADAKIVSESSVRSGVLICIGTKSLLVDEDLGSTTFRLEEGEIAAST